jgi:hypothetical protein
MRECLNGQALPPGYPTARDFWGVMGMPLKTPPSSGAASGGSMPAPLSMSWALPRRRLRNESTWRSGILKLSGLRRVERSSGSISLSTRSLRVRPRSERRSWS